MVEKKEEHRIKGRSIREGVGHRIKGRSISYR